MPFDPDAWKTRIEEIGESTWKKFIDVGEEKDRTKVISIPSKDLDISTVADDAVVPPAPAPRTSIPVTYYGYGSSGSYDSETADKEKRLEEVLKRRLDVPPGGWKDQEYAVMEQGPVTVEPSGPPKYTDTEINLMLMRADQLESQITDTTPEWLKLANQYTIINNRRKIANYKSERP